MAQGVGGGREGGRLKPAASTRRYECVEAYPIVAGLLAAAVVAVASGVALRDWRVGLVAGVAAAITWFVFVVDWALYGLSENGPNYYRFSAYVEYRDAAAVPIGVGYAVVTGLLVAGAVLAHRRGGLHSDLALAFAAVVSIGLPVAVPAALPRLEYGKDPVFHVTDVREDAATGRPEVCVSYGVQEIGADPSTDAADPNLCVQLPNTSTAPRLVTGGPSPDLGTKPYRLAEALYESGVRPYDLLDNLELDGFEIVYAAWTNPPPGSRQQKPPPGPQPQEPRVAEPAHFVPTGDAGTKKNLLRLAGILDACSAVDDYEQCADIDEIARAGIALGPEAGQLDISAVTDEAYEITGLSTSGNRFVISRVRDKPAARSCWPSGRRGCPASGRW